jgi:NitT/TauT family transport system permease protein
MSDLQQPLDPNARANRPWRAWRALRLVAPLIVGAAVLGGWEALVRIKQIPSYQLAPPSLIAATLVRELPALASAWWVTVQTMLVALAAAMVLGVAAAALFASSRVLSASFFPYAVILQVTPLVAVAPFIVLWVGLERIWLTQVVCAWIVAFFPILSNTAIGLRSADRGLRDLFALYGASRWQRLRWLLAPAALPYFLAGLKISANLALVGAIVAEFVIGPEAEHPGLATTILASQYRQDTPMMFAALAIISLTGVVTFFLAHLATLAALGRWHESALPEG